MLNLVFCDIETVPQHKFLPDSNMGDLFKKKFSSSYNSDVSSWDEIWQREAGLSAEFGKVISITIGTLTATAEGEKFYVKTFCLDSEKDLLSVFVKTLWDKKYTTLAGHNIKSFDGPFLMRRSLINGFANLPKPLSLMGLKPWELPFIDTMEMWGAGVFGYKISLAMLCEIMGVPSPKESMTGADVFNTYYGNFDLPWEKEDAMKNIASYNANDVIANARVYAKMKGFDVFSDDQVIFVK